MSWLTGCTSAPNSFRDTWLKVAAAAAAGNWIVLWHVVGHHRRSLRASTRRPSSVIRRQTTHTSRDISQSEATMTRGAAAPARLTTKTWWRHRLRVTWSVWRHRRLHASCPYATCLATSNRASHSLTSPPHCPTSTAPPSTWPLITWRYVTGRNRK